MLGQMSLPSIAATTGCLAPCDYREYRPIGEPILWVGRGGNKTVDETFIFQRNRQWQLFKLYRGLTEENYQLDIISQIGYYKPPIGDFFQIWDWGWVF